jgi:hypothetical protein
MTEQEWQACTDPKPMLEFLRGKASDRKLRLFAVACCRRIWPHLKDERSRGLVEVFEKLADGVVTLAKLRTAIERAVIAQEAIHWEGGDAVEQSAAEAVLGLGNVLLIELVLNRAAENTAEFVARVAWEKVYQAPGKRWSRHEQDYKEAFRIGESVEIAAQAILLRDIFGNPFRSVTVDPASLTVTTVARIIYEKRSFGRMPELADALEAAGCANGEILAHCRVGNHVRGCWVVDLLLGKE